MKREGAGQANFFLEMSEYQITAREFFSSILLDSLDRNFGLRKVLISYFDTHGRFLAWTDENGLAADGESHPYRKLAREDTVREQIYQAAVRDKLTYFNVTPRLYRSSDLIPASQYEDSAYVRFMETHFQAHYSATLAFGINAYIQITVFKSREEGDFTEGELEALREIYVYVANSYKNFKKYEQAKIVSTIQSKVISSGENSYFVTDDFTHILDCNKTAQTYLEEILGASIETSINEKRPCGWLAFLLGSEDREEEPGAKGDAEQEPVVRTRRIGRFRFKIYTYDQSYSNGIVDRYYWITITPGKAEPMDAPAKHEDKAEPRKIKKNESAENSREKADRILPLTQTEQKVAELMYQGLTYRGIADELVVSYHTVKKHVQNIYVKCGVKSRYQLYKWMEQRR